ncbi:MAG: AAA family ATPase [Adlercreutzia sp.]|nr:AAA family ATPase [Adlercreutzia sp.]
MEPLYQYMNEQLLMMDSEFHRYAYSSINWGSRMLGLLGPRGVGKTTLFLQRIKKEEDLSTTLYVSCDNLYFTTHSLVETADAFVKQGGTRLYIDEVHKYPNWSRELKQMYDTHPGLHVYFTGSSVLDIRKGEADLSRRAPQYYLQGLSFREYLAIFEGVKMEPVTLDDIVAHSVRIPNIEHPLAYFENYLRRGYYPFGSDEDFFVELNQVVSRTVEIDIPAFAKMNVSTGRKLKMLMAIISQLVPYKPNFAKLGGQIRVSRNAIEDYLVYLESAGMLSLLRSGAGLPSLGKPEKVYLDNTNLLYALAEVQPEAGTVRETFFLNQMRMLGPVYASPISDFEYKGMTFEIGGRSKGRSQLHAAKKGYVVKADIEYGYQNVLPLWAFGLLY